MPVLVPGCVYYTIYYSFHYYFLRTKMSPFLSSSNLFIISIIYHTAWCALWWQSVICTCPCRRLPSVTLHLWQMKPFHPCRAAFQTWSGSNTEVTVRSSLSYTIGTAPAVVRRLEIRRKRAKRNGRICDLLLTGFFVTGQWHNTLLPWRFNVISMFLILRPGPIHFVGTKAPQELKCIV